MTAVRDFCLMALACLMLFPGCESPSLPSESLQAETSAAPAEQAPVVRSVDAMGSAEGTAEGDDGVGAALSAWRAGQEGEAVQLLIAGESAAMPQAPDSAVDSVLNLTEEKFLALPTGDRSRVQAEALELASAARGLSRRTVAEGDAAAAAGDAQAAVKHFEGVLRLGESLARANRLTMLRMVGDAMVATAREKLSAAP